MCVCSCDIESEEKKEGEERERHRKSIPPPFFFGGGKGGGMNKERVIEIDHLTTPVDVSAGSKRFDLILQRRGVSSSKSGSM